MRSFSLKAVLAAALLSTSLVGAYAAASTDPGKAGEQVQAAQDPGARTKAEWQHDQNFDAQSTAVDTMKTGSIVTPAPQVKHVAARQAEYRPRLSHVVRELGTANHRMQVDHNRGYLTRAEYRALEGRSQAIRHDAMMTAARHDGALPRASYVSFQARVERLNHAIHRAATT